jgi:hypothetical protein
MRFSPLSFLLGVGAAWVLPVVSRVFRPLAVEATAMGMGVFEELRRVAAEQMETLEDIVEEARARREELAAETEPTVEAEPKSPDGAGGEGPR